MNAVFSILLLAAILGFIVFLLSKKDQNTRSDTDLFAYECRRENDGGFALHLTLHQPTQQPLDTLYTLRFDPGRQTIVTLIFIREAFGYKEPLFQPAMLDEFMLRKFDARRTK